jgi:hypothetical protein
MRQEEKIRLELEIPDWQVIKDPEFNDCFYVDFGKRIIRYNPELYWVRYAGTRKAPQIYGYAIRSDLEQTLLRKIEGQQALINHLKHEFGVCKKALQNCAERRAKK